MPKVNPNDGPIRVPKRNYVQDIAEQNGFQRVIDQDGNPMLLKPMPPDTRQPLDTDPKKKAKVIGPVQVASSRG